jgi:hypothetical protein
MFGLLPTRIHGFLDYLLGAAMVVIPLAFGFGAGPQTWLPVLLGGGLIIYSLLTDYEPGVVPIMGIPTHLALDVLVGLLLASSPWVFGFAWEVWIPHVLLGLAAVGSAIVTRTQPSHQVQRASGLKAPA